MPRRNSVRHLSQKIPVFTRIKPPLVPSWALPMRHLPPIRLAQRFGGRRMTLKQIIFLLRYFTFCPIKSSSIRTSAIGPFEMHECDGLNHPCKKTPVLLTDLLFGSFSCVFQIFSIYSQPEGDMSLRKPMLRTGADSISNRHPF